MNGDYINNLRVSHADIFSQIIDRGLPSSAFSSSTASTPTSTAFFSLPSSRVFGDSSVFHTVTFPDNLSVQLTSPELFTLLVDLHRETAHGGRDTMIATLSKYVSFPYMLDLYSEVVC